MNVKHCEEISAEDVTLEGAEGVTIRKLITKEDGAGNFVMRLFELRPGGHTPLHTHDWEHEIYVLQGTGTVEFEGETFPLTPGDILFVPPCRRHQFQSTDPTLFQFLCVVPAHALG